MSGPLSDRLGVKVGKTLVDAFIILWLLTVQTVVVPAGAALVFSVMVASLSTKHYQFILAQGILGGIACGIIFTAVASIVSQYFTTLRAWAVGVLVTGAAIGGIIFPIMLNRLLSGSVLAGLFAWWTPSCWPCSSMPVSRLKNSLHDARRTCFSPKRPRGSPMFLQMQASSSV